MRPPEEAPVTTTADSRLTLGSAAPGADALTSDGAIVRIRPVAPDDRAALVELYGRGSEDSLRLRFFYTPGQGAIGEEVDRLCRTGDGCHGAVLAVLAGTVVGVASYERTSARERRAEFAVFVEDAHRARGIGTLLLEHLAAAARGYGIAELVGEVLPGNARMLQVAHDLSGRTWSRFDDGIFDVLVRTAGDDETLRAIDERDRHAERASLRPLLAPRSVAVVGAGRAAGGVGHETLVALREYGFTGSLYAVNPHAAEVAGVAAYPSLLTLPAPVDLVVVAVPAAAVPGVIEDAAVARARAAVVLGSGFGEAGPQGRARQAEVLEIARHHGIRLVGPNCIGVVNTDPAVRLNASFAPGTPPAGSLAIASQSGAVGIGLLDHAARTGCGVSSFVSLGNKADVSGNDLIAYWFDDPATTAVALYLESFGNPRKFARTVRALARRKPVLAVKSGRSTAGRRAGASHTAAAAAPDATVDALFDQAGVVRADSLGELLDAARVLTDQPLPLGGRLAVLGNAGGFNVLAADAAGRGALSVPAHDEERRRRLTAAVPGLPVYDNPLDLGAAATVSTVTAAARELLADPAVDALLVVLVATRTNDVPGMLTSLGEVVDAHPEVTVAAAVIGLPGTPPTFGARRAPIFDLPERAVRALDKAARYAAWRREPLGRRPELPDVDSGSARRTVAAATEGWQPYPVTAAILRAYGIPLVDSVVVTDEDAAVVAGRATGYPVVVKSADPQLVHKTDLGAVRLHVGDDAAVRAAYRDVVAAGDPRRGALVQPTARGALELVTGVVHDPLFGSLVMVGLGGVHTDLFGDRALRLVPMTDLDAGRMWRSLRAAPVLSGFRGTRPVDTDALEDLLLRLGRLAEELPEVAELDLNPVLLGPDGVVAVDAKLRLHAVGAEPDPALRELRQA
jgi:acyl-CoA synthetase (NDP forming)/GNAT superfamily N-acetyltransferase